MKKLTDSHLAYMASRAIEGLYTLEYKDERMPYGEFAALIGLVDGEDDLKWHVWHRSQLTAVLCFAAAIQKNRNTFVLDRYLRLYNKATGESGAGVWLNARLERDPPEEILC